MNERKSTNTVGLIGTGMVGVSLAYAFMQHGLANELVGTSASSTAPTAAATGGRAWRQLLVFFNS